MLQAHDPYAALEALGLVLPTVPPSAANYASAVREGSLLFLSGQGPLRPGVGYQTGKVGQDVGLEEAVEHARLVGLGLLAVMEAELGSLSKVKRVVKLLGLVNAAPDFIAHPVVIDGCSNLFVSVFGETVGRHARSAVGVGSLPGAITVEIEAIVSVRD